jgi:Ni/Co efflux regulator RcnB
MKKIILAIAAIATVGVAVPAAAQPVDQREHRQEQRIRQGERSGALTDREARRLQHRETRLHRTEARMRWRNGGHLTPQQRHRLHRMENRDSRAIHRLKHNGRTD